MQTLVILDFGSQYTQLIARRSRELHVFSVILPFNAPLETIRQYQPKAIILSGGPSSVYDVDAPHIDKAIFDLGVPMLGVCYGLHVMGHMLGGVVEVSPVREYGKAKLELTNVRSKLLQTGFDNSTIWMSHGVHVAQPPSGFAVTAMSGSVICAIEDPDRSLYAIQFHPEVSHTTFGRQILENFLGLCGFRRDWSAGSIIDEQIAGIRKTVGKQQVICALSGGVDSTVAATLVNRAIGKQQTCIFVDTGLLRQDEYDEVLTAYKTIGLQVRPVKAAREFFRQLEGVTDPEQKRKIIGRCFITIFEKEAQHVKDTGFLVQGTLYPDVIESVSVKGPSVTIKSHHNVGGLPQKMQLRLIEPLRQLFKDEVRLIGKELGLPDSIVSRQPFPGPGLAIRIIGEVTRPQVRLLQQADAIVREELAARDLWQYFAILLPIKSVGVMGDGRTYEQVIAIRAIESTDGMTADWAKLPHAMLAATANRIVSEVKGVNRVVYDITSKPPGTIEWE